MSQTTKVALGLDYGTESVRALLLDMHGRELGSASAAYAHGQIVSRLPGTQESLPPDFALQHPHDWLDAAAAAIRAALAATGVDAHAILGVGVDFTSCTMLPAQRDGTPLCVTERFAGEKYAWPKLWKHHGAKQATDRINQIARERNEAWLARYGGVIGLEWFFPKVLETLVAAPDVYRAADVWLEAGDWLVWQLIGGPADQLPRSTCQAGYKAMWSADTGYPSADFLAAVHPELAQVVSQKMPGRLAAPGTCVGRLRVEMAQRLGLPADIAVSAAIIDAHAAVPGVGAIDAGTLVMVLGTSSCHMLNSTHDRHVPGVAGIVKDGILPGYYGYETGQAAVGDLFDWVRRLTGQTDFRQLGLDAEHLPIGADGVGCMDWMNGCRTPLMDGHLTGEFRGLTLSHTPAHLYRAAIEATAFGVRWIVDLLREHQVPVERFVATGGLPRHNPLIIRIYADVLRETIEIHSSEQGPARGAAILGALAALGSTGHQSPTELLQAVASRFTETNTLVSPSPQADQYERHYQAYRRRANELAQRPD